MLEKILNWFPEDDLLRVDGFDDAIIGIDVDDMRLIYSVSKCVDILSKDMDEEEALQFFHHDVKSKYLSIIPKCPIWSTDDL